MSSELGMFMQLHRDRGREQGSGAGPEVEFIEYEVEAAAEGQDKVMPKLRERVTGFL